MLFAAGLFWVFVRHLVIGTLVDVRWKQLVQALGDLMYWDLPAPLAGIAAAALLAWLVALATVLRRKRDDRWIFLIVSLFISPAALILWQAARHQLPPLEARYFVVLWPFVLLISAEMLATWIARKGLIRAIAICGLILFVGANLSQTVWFLIVGRGSYSQAVLYMMESTPARTVTIIADHPRPNPSDARILRRASLRSARAIAGGLQRRPESSASPVDRHPRIIQGWPATLLFGFEQRSFRAGPTIPGLRLFGLHLESVSSVELIQTVPATDKNGHHPERL